MKKGVITGFIFKIVVVLIGCVVTASAASAFDGGSRHHGKKGGEFGFGFLKQLDLTDAQKSGIAEIMDKYAPQFDALRSDLRQARQQMRATIDNSPFDESIVRAAYQQMSPLRENMFVLRAKMKTEIRSLLTADQIKTLEEKKDRRCEIGRERRDHRHAMIKKQLQMDTDTDETP
jgi:Spy/CpxP family protein refolding chaperone